MFHEELLLTTIFKVLNVLVLCGVSYYFFKTRVIHWLYQEIADKKEAEQALIRERELLKERTKNVAQAVEEQRQWWAKIQNNMQRWQKGVDALRKTQADQAEQRAQKSRERVETQSNYLTRHKVQQAVAGPALQAARASLEKQVDSSKYQRYIQNIVHYLQASNS